MVVQKSDPNKYRLDVLKACKKMGYLPYQLVQDFFHSPDYTPKTKMFSRNNRSISSEGKDRLPTTIFQAKYYLFGGECSELIWWK